MIRVPAGLLLDVSECRRWGGHLDAAAVLRDAGHHAAADDLARLALAAAASVAAAMAEPAADVADPRREGVATITLVEWAARNSIPERTARRRASTGKLRHATKRGGRWVVPDDGA